MGERQQDDGDSDEGAVQQALVLEEALVGDGLVRVREGDGGHAEERDAEPAAVEPAQAVVDVLLGAGDEGLVERVEGRVGGVVGADEDGQGRGRERKRHDEGKVYEKPYHRWGGGMLVFSGKKGAGGKGWRRTGIYGAADGVRV